MRKDYERKNPASVYKYRTENMTSKKLWEWRDIMFWINIIFSLGIAVPAAFLYIRVPRGFSIMVKNTE